MSTQTWQWQFDSKRQRLQIKMDDVLLDIGYKRRMLQQQLDEVCAFDMDDAQHFHSVMDYLHDHTQLNVNQQLQAAIHATAALRFLKPSMPQSWHFCFGDIEQWPQNHYLCELDSGLERCQFLIIDQDERSSLCMLLDTEMRLSPMKSLTMFDCIRVLNDRLESAASHPVPSDDDKPWYLQQGA